MIKHKTYKQTNKQTQNKQINKHTNKTKKANTKKDIPSISKTISIYNLDLNIIKVGTPHAYMN